MKSLGFVGKLAFALLLVLFGVNHFLDVSSYVTMVPNFLPIPILFVYLSGLALIASGVALIMNKKAQLAMLLLGVMLILFAVLVWLPKGDSGMPTFLRDLALASAAWFISPHVSD